MRWIDVRSDTVTTPTEEMRKAMYEAEVGDDVYGDDPTVNRLEALAAEMVGKEAALFVPSGTFGNQLALLTHTKRGDEVIVPDSNHIFVHEVGAAAVIASVQLRTIESPNGMPSIEKLRASIRGKDIHYPDTGLICMENAHSSGRVLPLEYLESVKKLADEFSIPVHLDGARIFNAAIASKVDVKKIAATADSVMFCLSKGLAAPVGSILAGSKKFIEKARKGRKLMGGGMRQAGILAAAGIVALEKMIDRLEEDHENAKLLAEMLSEIPGLQLMKDQLDINMVYFSLETHEPDLVIKEMKRAGIKINPPEGGMYRLVTNKDVVRADILKITNTFKEIVTSGV
ncbi:MAG: low-specificity L-threonine aldolase [Kosmotoga sp.]|uniref:low-specificity L-threonine aldolase n=1 Tax=Kosmotoga sp. TaxID=1955248 RepID=UPI001DB70139|nr:low-specificity L-threonine aldolase [Kosmotoga sp.]MBO8165833.1 low-specificity L-threonine aldolase [Kosmotoga sp.]